MARIKKALAARKKHKKVLKLAKGYYGAGSKRYKAANEAVMKALSNAYKGRKLKKRIYRKLWIARINAAARINGLSYSKFMYGLKTAGVEIDRKVLSEMAISDAASFAALANMVKGSIQ